MSKQRKAKSPGSQAPESKPAAPAMAAVHPGEALSPRMARQITLAVIVCLAVFFVVRLGFLAQARGVGLAAGLFRLAAGQFAADPLQSSGLLGEDRFGFGPVGVGAAVLRFNGRPGFAQAVARRGRGGRYLLTGL